MGISIIENDSANLLVKHLKSFDGLQHFLRHGSFHFRYGINILKEKCFYLKMNYYRIIKIIYIIEYDISAIILCGLNN